MVNAGGQRRIQGSSCKIRFGVINFRPRRELHSVVTSCIRNPGPSICLFLTSLTLAATLGAVVTAQTPAPSKAFAVAGKPKTFTGAPGVNEFVFQEQRGPSSFDRIALHRITLQPVPAAPGIVMLYLPGTNMNGEVAVDDPRYSLPLYLASHGVDFWALDYRTHFVPPSTPPAGLVEFRTWTNEMFEADISAAARFVMATSKRNGIFIAGFSRGVLFAYLYAAAHPENLKGLIVFDGSIGHGRPGSPPPDIYADDVSGKHLTWDKRQTLMRLVIDNPDAPAPLPEFKSAADNLNHVVYASAGFGGKGGLANPLAGLADPSVLARMLIRYDRYWPNVQDYEDSFTPAILDSLRRSRIPVIAFSSTNIAPDWSQEVAKSAGSTGSQDVTVKILRNWGHLDVICGTFAKHEVFPSVLAWLRRHAQAASESGG
jgi:pimeloyl-ACP methyl ester carboxylesterase